MSDQKKRPGTIGWIDLAVQDAEGVRAFYQQVVGWTAEPIDMGGYSDYCMMPKSSDDAVTGICHARGSNAELPPVWMIYIIVENLDESLAKVKQLGGTVILGPKSMGHDHYAVIKDPGGAFCALYQSA